MKPINQQRDRISQNTMKITIITVCFNASHIIDDTIESVIGQTYDNIEYIIIDGDSTDGTTAHIKKYASQYPITWISEKDYGIYDAMNKGIRRATGTYIQFLNAGDSLLDHSVIENVVQGMKKVKAHVYYGNIKYIYSNNTTEIRQYGRWCGKKIYFLTGDCINHQAIFAHKKCFKDSEFDTTYQICADREWMMRIMKEKYTFQSLDLLICNYSLDEESMSVKHKVLGEQEADRCVKTYFPFTYFIYKGFEFMRKHETLKNALHRVYRILYIRK